MATKRNVSTAVPSPGTNSPPATIVAGIETLVETQAAFIGEVDRLTRAWVRRRMEAVNRARHTVGEMKDKGDPASVFMVQQTWMIDALGRAMSDLSDFTSFAMNLASQAGGRVPGSPEKGLEAANAGLAQAGAKPHSTIPEAESYAEDAIKADSRAAGPGPARSVVGMLGDQTEEQNLNQPGNPAARITEAEVQDAFDVSDPSAPPK
jgi:hypothetical protein